MIITGGENVYSAEVESVIYQHPAVGACAVIGIPDETWGEAVHAIIVPRDGQSASSEEIIAFCRERIAGYKCPRGVEIRREPLPMSGAGKILKRELRAPFWEGKTRQVNYTFMRQLLQTIRREKRRRRWQITLGLNRCCTPQKRCTRCTKSLTSLL
jgi:acyl-coenzyme A synthetase/AMP-(fatty) acid ligase